MNKIKTVVFCKEKKIGIGYKFKWKKKAKEEPKKQKQKPKQNQSKKTKALTGFEPVISCLLDRRFNQLSHRATSAKALED